MILGLNQAEKGIYPWCLTLYKWAARSFTY